MTKVKFITKDRMLRNTYLNENIMFSNNVKSTILGFLGWKEKVRVMLIKRLLNVRIEEALEGCDIKYQWSISSTFYARIFCVKVLF